MVMVKINDRKDRFSECFRGPFLVLEKHEKYFKILKDRKADKISIRRLIPAHQLPIMNDQDLTEDDPKEIQKIKEVS